MGKRGRKPRPYQELFFESVDFNHGGCWEWKICRDSDGYGRFALIEYDGASRKTSVAHRLSYELFKGEIPRGRFVCHTCDNPPCVNPEHLFLGTPADNMADKAAKGRSARGRPGEPRQKLSDAQVVEARQRVADGEPRAFVARDMGVTRQAISGIVSGRERRFVPSK